MQKWASKIDIIQDQQEIHDSLPLVPDGTPPIAALGRPKTGGFRCTFVSEDSTAVSTCRYVGTSLKRIRQYLKDEHEWDLELKAGRRSAAMAEQERSNNPWRSGPFQTEGDIQRALLHTQRCHLSLRFNDNSHYSRRTKVEQRKNYRELHPC